MYTKTRAFAKPGSSNYGDRSGPSGIPEIEVSEGWALRHHSCEPIYLHFLLSFQKSMNRQNNLDYFAGR